MKDINNTSLLDIVPPNLKGNIDVIAASKAVDPQYQEIVQAIHKCILLPNIDNIDDEVLMDYLAKELKIDWYDEAASIEVKRKLLKSSDNVYMRRGTKNAVEQVVQDYFNDGKVEEWFEYEGEPYHFRVITTNVAVTAESADEFANAIEKVKNARSVLDEVIVSMTGDFNIYYGFIVHTGDFITVRQEA